MKLLLADDHTLFRSGIRLVLLEVDPDLEVIEAGAWDDTIAALQKETFDLVLTDLRMPGMDAAAGIAELKTISPEVPIVVVSMVDTPTDIRRAVDAGATGFIPKSSTPKVMIEAIKLVLAGGVYLPPSVLAASHLANGTDEFRAPPQPLRHLTDRQKAVLGELAQGKSNKQIARALNISEATVKVHIAAIMRALDARNRTQAVLAAAQLGLVHSPSLTGA